MEEKDFSEIDLSKLNAWERCCSFFWNIFYSFLIINEIDVVIKDLNIMTYNLLSNDLENFTTTTTKTSNTKDNIINLLEKQQNFIIDNNVYSVSQNFIGIKIEETKDEIKIIFYYFTNDLDAKSEIDSWTDSGIDQKRTYLFFSIFDD